MATSRQSNLDERVKEYLAAVRAQRSHTGKVIQFVRFLEKTYALTSSDYEVEEPVGHLQVRGRIDTVVGDSLFEFKTDLIRELPDAQAQLKKYLQSFRERSPLRRCVGIATDGIKFRVYQADFSRGAPPELHLIEEQDISKLSAEDAVLWLDRYLFRQTPKFPDEKDVSARFGAGSPTYALTMALMRQWWREVKDKPSVALKYEVWQKQLTIVYGEGVKSEDLFLKHTYLATLAKLLASIVFAQPALGGDEDILTGGYFLSLGIHNFIEEDLFAWLLHPEIKVDCFRLIHDLRTQLRVYEPSGFTEDVLKGLYQELVDPQMRHDLGEFYTPDWLAEEMLRRTLGKSPTGKVLDPACGSGTFLFLAIRLLVEALTKRRWPKTRILSHIQQNIVGMDVHPLAVLIARTNYLLAAAPLLPSRRAGPFSVPVYLGDSLMYRSMVGTMMVPDVNVSADDKTLWFPQSLRDDPSLFDEVIDKAVYWAEQPDAGREAFQRFLDQKGITGKNKRVLLDTLTVLGELFHDGRNSIWRFIIKNLVRPYILSKGQPFDLVVGNPPWLSLRYIKSGDYQGYIKKQMAALKIKPKGARLVTQLELAALFFAEAVGKYLRDGGIIAFVMPRSVLIRQQYREFVNFTFGPIGVKCEEILDLEDVAPVFSVPACVITASKGRGTRYPVKRIVFQGRLPRKNAGWAEAKKLLKVSEDEWRPAKRREGTSYYLKLFRQGATLVPRRFWFIRFVRDPVLGFNPAAPLVESDTSVPTKKPWDQVTLRGQVETPFLYASVLSTDVVPFRCLRVRPVALPVLLDSAGNATLLTSDQALRKGYQHLGRWLERAEAEWQRNKTESSPSRLIDWLDYMGKLTAQFPQYRRYAVLYAASARELVAAVLNLEGALKISLDGVEIPLNGLVADAKVYWHTTDSKEEAYYLCAWLNSQAVDDVIRPKAIWGCYRERDIHKRPLELPLPRFSAKDADHCEMAELAEKAAAIVEKVLPSIKSRSLGAIRRKLRTHPHLAPLLSPIDELARKIANL